MSAEMAEARVRLWLRTRAEWKDAFIRAVMSFLLGRARGCGRSEVGDLADVVDQDSGGRGADDFVNS